MKTQYERKDVIPLLAEIFRDLGYEGTSLSRITERTGLGKGSLYHFFPGGKEEMAGAVLAHIDQWFEREIYRPLREEAPAEAIAAMWESVDSYFQSGGRVCLVGAFALEATRDRFADAVEQYFRRWIKSLAAALVKLGASEQEADRLAEDGVLTIQGAIVLSRALADPGVFTRALGGARHRIGMSLSGQ